MADVALRTADASELATYLSHVYRQPIPTDHVAMRNASTSTMHSGSGTLCATASEKTVRAQEGDKCHRIVRSTC